MLLLAEPLREKGSVQFFGPGTTPLNWISAEDVADFAVRALDAGPRNGIDVIGGPDNLSRREVLELIEQVLGRDARRRHVPVTAMRALRAGRPIPSRHALPARYGVGRIPRTERMHRRAPPFGLDGTYHGDASHSALGERTVTTPPLRVDL